MKPLSEVSSDRVLPGVPWIESPFFREELETAGLAPELEAVASQLHSEGYVIFDFDDPDFDAVAQRIVRDLDGKHTGAHSKVLDAWRANEDVRRLAANESVLKLVSTLYGRRAIPFQTLNFCRGTEQHIHSDAVHFSSVPERFMCGVWVAFEDIGPDNGPLVYYPGSHRLPIYDYLQLGLTGSDQEVAYDFYRAYERLFRELVKAHGLKEQVLCIPRGKALIWAANLIHGGAPQRDRSLTRHSQVTHYYFENCAYYAPSVSDPFLGRVRFRPIVDISTGKAVPHQYNGQLLAPWSLPEDPAAARSPQRSRGGRVLDGLRSVASLVRGGD